MDKEKLENNIKKNYEDVQNYLQGDPGAEGFLDSLADLQTNFADYLIETLKMKKYGKDDVTKSNIYQGHIKGGKYKYIDNEKLEHIISNKVLGKKVSIDSLMDKGIQKIKELFDTQKSFEEALKQGKIQSVQLNDIILPPDDLHAPITGSGKGFEKKELNQNKLWIFISALRDFGIYLDDLIIYTGKIDENIMRESTYYAIFIPRENKTVFLNTGYGEATFVCEGEISIEDMTTLGKEKLQSKLGAIKISFSEKDIEGWKNELKNAILGNNGKVGKKIEKKQIKEIVNRINKFIELENFKCFYEEHKDESFTDSEGNKVKIKDLFKSHQYYDDNYKIINREFNINLPSHPNQYYKMRRNNILKYLGIAIKKQAEIITMVDLKLFYEEHKDESFTDSEGNKVKIKDLFKSSQYYYDNYKIINREFNINLPSRPKDYYKVSRNNILKYLGIAINFEKQVEIITIENLKLFYEEHKDELFTDSKGNKVQIKDLFKSCSYYRKIYKKINSKFNLNLPGGPEQYYKMRRNEILKYLNITINREKQAEIITMVDLKLFYEELKDEPFTDSKGNKVKIKDLFKSRQYYNDNYKILNREFNINLPSHPDQYYKIKRNKIKLYLGIN